jgi:tyrosyl-tRNA synthetase
MTAFQSDFLRVLSERGYIHQITDSEGLDGRAKNGPLTLYIGFDCTAPSLHIGHLVSIMLLHWAQATGHRPIALMGGGTTKVGDPSGKDEARKLLTDAYIDANLASIKTAFNQFLKFGDGPTDALMINNADWLDTLAYIPFLRDIGRHFSVNRMLTMDSVRMRLEREQPLSFLEFNYMVLQSYDFLELNRRFGCQLQMGGSDQWGNIVMGVELGRRVDGVDLYGATTPLITTADGRKMGKTAQGAVWLNGDLLAPYEYWQFWRNTADADVGRFLRLFTTLSLDEIARLESLAGAEINDAKKILANEATGMLHGIEAAQTAEATARKTFEEAGSGEALPRISIDLAPGLSLVDAFVKLGLTDSKAEARRLIKQGGARVNGTAVSAEDYQLTHSDLDDGGEIRLSAGKKRHGVIEVA